MPIKGQARLYKFRAQHLITHLQDTRLTTVISSSIYLFHFNIVPILSDYLFTCQCNKGCHHSPNPVCVLVGIWRSKKEGSVRVVAGAHGCGYFNFWLSILRNKGSSSHESQFTKFIAHSITSSLISSAGSFITSRATLYFLVALRTNIKFFYEADASNEIMSALM